MDNKMKAAVLLGNSTSFDITRDEMKRQWQQLGEIEGLEFEILPYDKRPSGEQVSAMVAPDTDALFGLWISPQYITDEFFCFPP